MQYRSLIRVLEYCGIDCGDVDVVKAKKALAAEFAIAPGGFITIDGLDYTKNDVFTELEHEDFMQRLSYHMLIWQTPNLLNCLEKNIANLKTVKTLIKLHADNNNRPYIRFISSCFAHSFDKIMRNLLYEERFRDAGQWLKTLCLIDNADDEYTALSSTRNCIADFIKLLRNLNDVTCKDHLQDLEKWFSKPWSLFVNQLPDSLYDTKHELLSAMVDFTFVNNQADIKLCLKASKQMRKVICLNDSLRKLIVDNHAIYIIRSRKQFDDRNLGWLIAVFIFSLFIIRTCNPDSTTKSRYSPSKSTNTSLPKISQKDLLRGYASLCFNGQRSKTGEFFLMFDSIRDRGNFNKELQFSSTSAYYMFFEKKDTLSSIKIRIMNNGSDTLHIHANEGKLKFTVAPSTMLWIEGSTNAIDLLHFPQKSDPFAVLFSITSVLISDTKNQVAHIPKLSNVRSHLNYNTIQPAEEADFTVELLKDPQTGIYRLTFSGVYWVF